MVAAQYPVETKRRARHRTVARRSHPVRNYTPATRRQISKRQRATDISTSISVSLAAAALVTTAVFLTTDLLKDMSQAVYFAAITMLAAWGLIIPSKLWEGVRGETTPRRFAMMVVGMGLGAAAFGLATMLMVELPHDGSQPPAMVYMAGFGTLFLLMRWWRQADPLRNSRLSLWSVVVTAAVAGLVASAWGFPQPWLVMVAGAISVSVQLASPWVHPHRRYRRQNA